MPALRIAESSREALKKVHDYTCLFNKRELIGKRLLAQSMEMKVREQPFSVHLDFINPHKGREVLYVKGANQGQLLVHEEGLKKVAGTVSLQPESSDAMNENRHPITKIGLTNLLNTIIAQWESEAKYDETEVTYYPDAKLGQAPCKVIMTSHPAPRTHFKFHMTRLYIDKQTNLPIRVEQYAWPVRPGESPPLLEEYTYSNLKLNAGLTDRDFDPRNPAYRF